MDNHGRTDLFLRARILAKNQAEVKDHEGWINGLPDIQTVSSLHRAISMRMMRTEVLTILMISGIKHGPLIREPGPGDGNMHPPVGKRPARRTAEQ
jgi:hypothetical protein